MMDQQVVAASPQRKKGSHQIGMNDLEMYETFFTISSDLICIVGLDGYFQKINPAFERALGYTQEEVKQRSFLDLTHPDDVVRTLAEIATLKKQNPLSNLTNRYRCQDGTYRWLTWSSQPIKGTNLVHASARDMTEEKRRTIFFNLIKPTAVYLI